MTLLLIARPNKAPDMIKDAFSVPAPFTCLTPCAMSSAPAPMGQMLEKVEALKALDLSPIVKMLQGLAENLGEMDVSKVKYDPKFMSL